jgi:DNA-directed RNA polymerase specialized sigma24 family protein
MSTQYDNWAEKPDEFLLSALRSENSEEWNEAVKALRTKYQQDLLRYVKYLSKKLKYAGLGEAEPEDVTQEAWAGVDIYIKNNEVKKGFKQLLLGIAHNKCVDIARKQKGEWSIENNIPSQENIEEFVVDE